MDEVCETCDGTEQVTYCHAWGCYLCVSCRAARNDEALRVHPVPLVSKPVYPSQVALDVAYLEAVEAAGKEPAP
jgi:hypothetical protein